jgi:hypothetical protein
LDCATEEPPIPPFRKDPTPVLTFTCVRKDEGVIVAPVPAQSCTPDWFRKLKPVDEARVSPTDTGLELPVPRPLNRPNGIFDIVAGIVATDTYRAPIHFPFCATGPDALHEVAMGSPVVQVIPSRRETMQIEADIRSETEAEAEDRDRIRRLTDAAPGWSRENARAKRWGRARRLLACRPFRPSRPKAKGAPVVRRPFVSRLVSVDQSSSSFEFELDDPLPRLSSSSLCRQLRVSNRTSPLRAVRSR